MASDHIVPLAFVSLVLILAAVVWIAFQGGGWYRMTRLQRRRLTAWWYVYSFALPGLAIVALFGALVWLWWQRRDQALPESEWIVQTRPTQTPAPLPVFTADDMDALQIELCRAAETPEYVDNVSVDEWKHMIKTWIREQKNIPYDVMDKSTDYTKNINDFAQIMVDQKTRATYCSGVTPPVSSVTG